LEDNNDRNIFTKVNTGKVIQITCSDTDTFLIDESNTMFACGQSHTNVFEIVREDIKYASAGNFFLSYIDMNDEVWVEDNDSNFKQIGIKAKFISLGSRSTYIIDMKNDVYVYSPYETLTKYAIKAKYCSAASSYVLFIDMNNNVWIEGYNKFTHVRQKTKPYILKPLNIKARYVACKYYHSFIIS
jgi:alpha-tubulin suppressor-like RCC1 family protein